MRLKQYPAGCGKGHDAAVLGAWLQHAMLSMDAADVVETWFVIIISLDALNSTVDLQPCQNGTHAATP